jgi:two-component system, OmpR family, sensor histidine kinase SenX3
MGDWRRWKSGIFIAFGACLVALAVALNIGWIVLNWRAYAPLALGVFFFSAIIAGLIVKTVFLVREIRRNEQQDSFLNAVTHELKTPVASIRLYLETLQSHEVDPAKRAEFYRTMMADTDRLMHTIDQVLRAGKLGPSKKASVRVPLDLRDVVQECLAVVRRRHSLPAEALQCSESLPPGESATILGDVDELQAAILNLLDNAVKYSGEQVRVFVDIAKVDARRVAVRVRDAGVGIPADQLKRIFSRFYRIPDAITRRVKGTGLGLFIVRTIAEKHGGKVYAESEGAGHGSTFTLQLPLARNE